MDTAYQANRIRAEQLTNALHALYERLNLTESDKLIKLPLDNAHRPVNLDLVSVVLFLKRVISVIFSWKKKSIDVKNYVDKICVHISKIFAMKSLLNMKNASMDVNKWKVFFHSIPVRIVLFISFLNFKFFVH